MAEPPGSFSIDRMFEAVEAVKRRLIRAVRALEAAAVPYAVAGGHAVAVWVEVEIRRPRLWRGVASV